MSIPIALKPLLTIDKVNYFNVSWQHCISLARQRSHIAGRCHTRGRLIELHQRAASLMRLKSTQLTRWVFGPVGVDVTLFPTFTFN